MYEINDLYGMSLKRGPQSKSTEHGIRKESYGGPCWARVLVPSAPSILGNGRFRFHLGWIDFSHPTKVKSELSVAKHGRPEWGQHPRRPPGLQVNSTRVRISISIIRLCFYVNGSYGSIIIRRWKIKKRKKVLKLASQPTTTKFLIIKAMFGRIPQTNH